MAGLEAQLTIDRLACRVGGGKYCDMGTIGKEVDVHITLEVNRMK